MDWFDGEIGGGRGEHDVEPGGSWNWVTVVIIGVIALLAVLAHEFFGMLFRLI